MMTRGDNYNFNCERLHQPRVHCLCVNCQLQARVIKAFHASAILLWLQQNYYCMDGDEFARQRNSHFLSYWHRNIQLIDNYIIDCALDTLDTHTFILTYTARVVVV